MAKQTSLYVTDEIVGAGASFVNADGTAYKTVYTAGADDAVVKSLMATSNDTAAVNLKIAIHDGTADRIIGTVNVPATSGTNGTAAAVDLLAAAVMPGLPLDQNGKRIIPMQNGHLLKVAPLVAVTATKQVDVFAMVEEY
jgi:hypothetical protein